MNTPLSPHDIAKIMNGLRAGKSVKEIGVICNKSKWAIYKLIERREELRAQAVALSDEKRRPLLEAIA